MKKWTKDRKKECNTAAVKTVRECDNKQARVDKLTYWATDGELDNDFKLLYISPGKEVKLSNEQCCNFVNTYCSHCYDLAVNGTGL